MTTSSSTIENAVDGHLAAYTESDVARRADLIAAAWTADGKLVDPPLQGVGHDGICAAAEALLTHYAGHTFRRTSGVDAHNDAIRYAWELVSPDGAVVLAGLDVGEVTEDGRLKRITGFFGDLPER